MLRPALPLLARAFVTGDFAAVRARIRTELGEAGRRTLDLACGPGLFADVFTGEDYVGIDSDLRNVAWARRARPGAFLVGSRRRAELPDGRFDQALAFGVVEILADPEVAAVLRDLRRLLAAGGRALVIVEVPRAGVIGRLRRLLPGPRPCRAPDALGDLLGTPAETFQSGLLEFALFRLRWS